VGALLGTLLYTLCFIEITNQSARWFFTIRQG
jgi:hypothetical protein